MKLIRNGIFETNSSSTHSLVLCTKEKYDKWQRGELFILDGDFFTYDERISYLKRCIIDSRTKYDRKEVVDEVNNSTKYVSYYTYKGVTVSERNSLYTKENLDEITIDDINEWLESDDSEWEDYPLSFEEYYDRYADYEDFYDEYRTPKGDIVSAFGYYGYD